jgi:hypothetical protein
MNKFDLVSCHFISSFEIVFACECVSLCHLSRDLHHLKHVGSQPTQLISSLFFFYSSHAKHSSFICSYMMSFYFILFIRFHLFSFGYIHSHLFSLVFIHFKLKITHSFTFLIGFNHRITDSYSITCTMLTHCKDIIKLV